jgi:hypothetical protein
MLGLSAYIIGKSSCLGAFTVSALLLAFFVDLGHDLLRRRAECECECERERESSAQMVTTTEAATNYAPRVFTTMVTRVKRWERVAEKTVARCGPPSTDDYYLCRMFA